jgi:predicted hydrolase (HD superfamily)
MHEWTASDSLRTHMEAVAAATAAYADRLDPEHRDRWFIAGLLHDFDYEKHPSEAEHPFVGVQHLGSLDPPDEVEPAITRAILGHAQYSGVPRDTPMARALFACDELAGFCVACAKVRPEGVATLQPKSVKKKLKDKSFAAAVSREDIHQGVDELAADVPGLDLTQHIQNVIDALAAERERLGI